VVSNLQVYQARIMTMKKTRIPVSVGTALLCALASCEKERKITSTKIDSGAATIERSEGLTANGEKLAWVASIRDKNGSADKAHRALLSAGIEPLIVVSLGTYGINVAEKDRERAVRILLQDAKENNYVINSIWSETPQQ
jgi:hypothetical protein